MLCDEPCWPPPRDTLRRVTIELLSVHGIPKPSEQRPRLEGTHCESHRWIPELSGANAPPDSSPVLSPSLSLSLHPIGGFCSISSELPPRRIHTTYATATVQSDGLAPHFGETVHCLAAEPEQTFLRISVLEHRQGIVTEVAYETAVLGRLRPGYRVMQLRSRLGTRVELCYLLVKISLGEEPHKWTSAAALRVERLEERSVRVRSPRAKSA